MRRFIVVMLTVLETAGSASADDPALRMRADAEKKKKYEGRLTREWTSESGAFKVTAKYLKYDKGYVTLEKTADKKTVKVLVTRLSKTDQAWVTAELKRTADSKGKRR
jgi:hypothetical protein